MGYEITFKYNKKEKMYWASTTHGGKSAVIAFYDEGHRPYSSKDPTIIHELYVAFGVGSSRKQVLNWILAKSEFIDAKITGNGSVSYLYFARDALRAFQSYIRVHLPPDRYLIRIQGTDTRRFRIYRKYLQKRGYVYFPGNSLQNPMMIGNINTLDPDE